MTDRERVEEVAENLDEWGDKFQNRGLDAIAANMYDLSKKLNEALESSEHDWGKPRI